MSSLKAFAKAKREASENAGSYEFDSLQNCTIELVDSWEWESSDGEIIELVGVKFTDEDGDPMQLNTLMDKIPSYSALQALVGSLCHIRAKRFLDKEGKPNYQGRETEWAFASATVVPVNATIQRSAPPVGM